MTVISSCVNPGTSLYPFGFCASIAPYYLPQCLFQLKAGPLRMQEKKKRKKTTDIRTYLLELINQILHPMVPGISPPHPNKLPLGIPRQRICKFCIHVFHRKLSALSLLLPQRRRRTSTFFGDIGFPFSTTMLVVQSGHCIDFFSFRMPAFPLAGFYGRKSVDKNNK